MRAAAATCPRTFTILTDGGVRATFACGAVIERPEETAVDVAVLAERFPQAHHHHGHLRPGRRGQ